MEERFVTAAGLRTRYFEAGKGAAVVLLHGASLGSSCDVWSEVVERLAARGLRVLAPDLPGFGGTDNPEDVSLGFRTRFVPEFMTALGLEGAAIVGHSQAGRIAVALGAKETPRASRIVIVGTGSLLPPLPGAGGSGEGEEGEGTNEPTIEECRALLESQLFDASRATAARVQLRFRMSLGKNFAASAARREAKSRAKGEKAGSPAWQRLSEVTVPLRLVYGAQDREAGARAVILREAIPAIDLHLVDRCSHLVMWDAPEALASLIGG